MKQCILCICASILFFTACSDISSIQETSNLQIEARQDNCFIAHISKDDPTEECDGFNSIDLVGDELHFSFDDSYFNNISECLENTFLFDPSGRTITNTPNCGERNTYPEWCKNVDDEILIVELGTIDQAVTIELCFVTECSDFNQLLVDCLSGDDGFATSYEPPVEDEEDEDCSLGTFCFEVEIDCD